MDLQEFENLNHKDKIKFFYKYNLIKTEHEELNDVRKWIVRGIMVTIAIIFSTMAGCPVYNVWQQRLEGEAELARAEQNRQIAINEAKAIKESAKYKAEAEIERAGGIQKANEIIKESLGGAEGYLRYLYIDALQSTNCQTIYIPTEAGLPLLEARNKTNLGR